MKGQKKHVPLVAIFWFAGSWALGVALDSPAAFIACFFLGAALLMTLEFR